MSQNETTQELLEFPCHYEYKVFGPGDDHDFVAAVQSVIGKIAPVSRDAMKTRASSGGKYQCVSALVLLQNRGQLEAIYTQLRMLPDLKYLL
ncbi:MAG: DUF493 domain-containing protein [Desulfuromonadales bacterium]|nr:DUF493 domain-containing protein [Desulfuromonadales bacterium]